ncbi:hypothetical protein F5Y13DRAFT_184894 [Hypoxylon sp. FL1857]|nr:hypothetical protein F5Y13DRAFT_184894 [Hypoxylon sp. FL1857]
MSHAVLTIATVFRAVRYFNLPSTPPATPQIENGTLLTVKGIIFDTITGLSAFHATESDKSYPLDSPREEYHGTNK